MHCNIQVGRGLLTDMTSVYILSCSLICVIELMLKNIRLSLPMIAIVKGAYYAHFGH